MKKLLTLKTGFIAYFAILSLFLILMLIALQHLSSSIDTNMKSTHHSAYRLNSPLPSFTGWVYLRLSVSF